MEKIEEIKLLGGREPENEDHTHTYLFFCYLYCNSNALLSLIAGAGVYVLTGTHTGAIPNNSLVIARTSSQSLQFYCVSNSTTNGVGRIIGKSGSDITWASSDAFVISHYNPGGLQIVSPYSYQYRRSYYRYETRYERVSSQYQGIYTCKIPDARGSLLDINFGIYMHSFNSKLTFYWVSKQHDCVYIVLTSFASLYFCTAVHARI